MPNFVAIDLELANNNTTSICEIGIAVFEKGKMVQTWTSLINPKQAFSSIHSKIHGISITDVQHSPTLAEVLPHLQSFLAHQYVVSYGLLDLHALQAVYGNAIPTYWFDATHIVRKVWTQFANGGFALHKMTEFLNLPLENHHQALDDAIACGEIVCAALKKSKTRMENWPCKKNF